MKNVFFFYFGPHYFVDACCFAKKPYSFVFTYKIIHIAVLLVSYSFTPPHSASRSTWILERPKAHGIPEIMYKWDSNPPHLLTTRFRDLASDKWQLGVSIPLYWQRTVIYVPNFIYTSLRMYTLPRDSPHPRIRWKGIFCLFLSSSCVYGMRNSVYISCNTHGLRDKSHLRTVNDY